MRHNAKLAAVIAGIVFIAVGGLAAMHSAAVVAHVPFLIRL